MRMPDRAETRPSYRFEPLPYEEWRPTKETLHLWCQIVGKIRMATHPRLNHWWHVTLYVSPRGLTTGTIPYGGASFDLEFDFFDHQLMLRRSDGDIRRIPLPGLSVARFYQAVVENLAQSGIRVEILPHPYQHSSKVPFADDHQHAAYDRAWVERYWRTLLQINGILREFSGRFLGKQTPVHLFWHSFDLALTRFSGRPAPPLEAGSVSDREAYSHEVISFGFWPGDDTMREPALYSYTYPEPLGLASEPLSPGAAFWAQRNNNHLAVLPYNELVTADNPKPLVLEFLESAYQAGARRAAWPIEDFVHTTA